MSVANVLGRAARKTFLNNVGTFFVRNKSLVLTGTVIGLNSAELYFMYKSVDEVKDILSKFKAAKEVAGDDKEAIRALYKPTMIKLTKALAPVMACYIGITVCVIVEHKDIKRKDKTIETLTAAYGVAQTAIASYKDFKEEAVKELGEEKVKDIENTAIVNKAVEEDKNKKATGLNEDFVAQDGYLAYIDPFTHRLFHCSTALMDLIESDIDKALNNPECVEGGDSTCDGEPYIPLTYWYDKIKEIDAPEWSMRAVIMKDSGSHFYISTDTFDTHDPKYGPVYIPKFRIYTINDNGYPEQLM